MIRTASSLEDQLQSELVLSGVEGQIRLRDLTETTRTEYRNSAHRSGVDARESRAPLSDRNVGLSEVLRIGDVVNFGSELQLHLLEELEVFEDRNIRAPLFRPVQLGTRFVPNRTYRLGGEFIHVDPVVVVLVRRCIRLAGNHVGTVGCYQVAHVRRHRSYAIEDGKRYARLIEGQHIKLPSAYRKLHHACSRFAERQLIVHSERKAVLDADVRIAPIVG